MSDYTILKKDTFFFNNVYMYYIRGGYSCIFVENILNIIIVALTLIFVLFACFFLDWHSIGKCNSEETCKSLSSYIISPTTFHDTSVNVCMFLFISIFLVYWISINIAMIRDLFVFKHYRTFFKECLNITTNDMKDLKWNDIVTKITTFDNTVTVEHIVGAIMRKDNYLILIAESDIMGFNKNVYTFGLIWLINIAILNQIFSGQHNNRKRLIVDRQRMQTVVKILGFLQFFAIPFTLSILLIHYIVNFTTDLYTKRSIGPKEWTTYAKLLFREYNELPHIFNERIMKSYKFASLYEKKFYNTMINIIFDKIIFIFGSYLTLLVILTFYDERMVMYIRLFDRNLLWFIAIFTSIISLARMMTTNPYDVDETEEEIMTKISEHTRYFPDEWKTKCHKLEVFNKFNSLYTYKITSVFFEIIAVFTIPVYMMTVLPKKMNGIIKLIEVNTIYDDKLGHICRCGVEVSEKYDIISEQNSETTIQIDNKSDNKPDTIVTPLIQHENNIQIDNQKVDRSIRNFKSYYFSARK